MSDADTVLKLLVLQELLRRSDDSSSSAKCTSLLEAGLKVVRGPDWKWGNQDGGEGHVGTVVQVGSSSGTLDKQVIVVWDNGVRGNYRIGHSNAYDLRTLDNSSIGVNHPSVYCSTCHTNKMKGMRWTCKVCYDYDLCTRCYMGDRHDITHPFIRFQTNYGNQVDVPKREGSVKIPMRGIFSSAKVVRGDDWRWEGQDGGPGNSGIVIDVRGWDDDTDWTSCNVIWSHNSSSNKYRIGYEGKMDLKCIEDAPDGYYYRDHLPITAQDLPPGSIIRSKTCFRTKKFRECNASLAESFISTYPNVANIKPRTLVYLFTPARPNKAEPLHECGGALPPHSTYDPNAYTEIFIHGWLDGVCRTAWMMECKDLLFERARGNNSSYNVILVDWTWGNTPEYYMASANCKIVGQQVGFVINNIMRQMGIGPEKFHVIGHSFGAIAAGFTGRMVPGLRRITALDPSVSPFWKYPPELRVTYRDAQIVDVIHSNSGPIFQITYGDPRPLGHADFYPNGGTIQKSCISYAFMSLIKGDILYGLGSLLPKFCYHLQSIQYYKISINSNGCEYLGVAKESFLQFLYQSSSNNEWTVMGMDYEFYHKNDGQQRKYYLKTANKYPYYDSQYSINIRYPFETCAAQ